jgi:hypothetical protein
MRYCQDKDIHRLVAQLVRTGWNYSHGRHGKLRNPEGTGFVTIPSTPSDFRVLQNIQRDIRRIESMRSGSP